MVLALMPRGSQTTPTATPAPSRSTRGSFGSARFQAALEGQLDRLMLLFVLRR